MRMRMKSKGSLVEARKKVYICNANEPLRWQKA